MPGVHVGSRGADVLVDQGVRSVTGAPVAAWNLVDLGTGEGYAVPLDDAALRYLARVVTGAVYTAGAHHLPAGVVDVAARLAAADATRRNGTQPDATSLLDEAGSAAVVAHDRPMTPDEVARRLRCSIEHVRRLLRDGRLVGVKDGRTWLVLPSDLAAFVDSRRTAA